MSPPRYDKLTTEQQAAATAGPVGGSSNIICRVEIPKKGLFGSAVRYMRGGRKFGVLFQDKYYGDRDSSYSAAEAALRRIPADAAETRSLSLKLRVRNSSKSGIPGVTRYVREPDKAVFWLAYWTDAEGKKRMRKFAVAKYGERIARQLAIQEREAEITPATRRFNAIIRQHVKLDRILHDSSKRGK